MNSDINLLLGLEGGLAKTNSISLHYLPVCAIFLATGGYFRLISLFRIFGFPQKFHNYLLISQSTLQGCP